MDIDKYEANLALGKKFVQEVMVEKNLENLSEYMQEDYLQHSDFVEQGREGFRKFFDNWFEVVPDHRCSLEMVVADDEQIWAYCILTGTPRDTWMGIPASGRSYYFRSVDIWRVRDGKLAEHWDVSDNGTYFSEV